MFASSLQSNGQQTQYHHRTTRGAQALALQTVKHISLSLKGVIEIARHISENLAQIPLFTFFSVSDSLRPLSEKPIKDARASQGAPLPPWDVVQGMGKVYLLAAAAPCWSDRLDRHSLLIILFFGPNQICRICMLWSQSQVGEWNLSMTMYSYIEMQKFSSCSPGLMYLFSTCVERYWVNN